MSLPTIAPKHIFSVTTNTTIMGVPKKPAEARKNAILKYVRLADRGPNLLNATAN
jgi:hypothetical protein